ncbi:MAG: hypothetical protein PVG98_15690 [Chromatiales bacterium]|jgi:hypothetical protein
MAAVDELLWVRPGVVGALRVSASAACSVLQGRIGGEAPRQQLLDAVDRMLGDSVEYIAEGGPGVNASPIRSARG